MNYKQLYSHMSVAISSLGKLRTALGSVIQDYANFIHSIPQPIESVEDFINARFSAKFTPEEAFMQLSEDFYFNKTQVEELLAVYRDEKSQAEAELIEIGSKASLRSEIAKFEELVEKEQKYFYSLVPNEYELEIVHAAAEIQAMGASIDDYHAALQASSFTLWRRKDLVPLYEAIKKFEELKQKHGFLYEIKDDRWINRPINWMPDDDFQTVLHKNHVITKKAAPLGEILEGNEDSLAKLKARYDKHNELTAKLSQLEQELFDAFMTHVNAFKQQVALQETLGIRDEIKASDRITAIKPVAVQIYGSLLKIHAILDYSINTLLESAPNARRCSDHIPDTVVQIITQYEDKAIGMINIESLVDDAYTFYLRPVAWAKERLSLLEYLMVTEPMSGTQVIKTLFNAPDFEADNAGGNYFFTDQIHGDMNIEDLQLPDMRFIDGIGQAVYFPAAFQAPRSIHQQMKPANESGRPAITSSRTARGNEIGFSASRKAVLHSANDDGSFSPDKPLALSHSASNSSCSVTTE